jgi:hypothetical protein
MRAPPTQVAAGARCQARADPDPGPGWHCGTAGPGAAAHSGVAMDPVVSVGRLAAHAEDPDLRVFDATIRPGRVLWLTTFRSGRPGPRPRAHPRRKTLLPVHAPTPRTWGDARADRPVLGARCRRAGRGKPLHSGALRRPRQHADGRTVATAAGVRVRTCRGPRDRVVRVAGRGAHEQSALLESAAGVTAHPRPGLIVGRAEVVAAVEDPRVVLVDGLGRRQHRGRPTGTDAGARFRLPQCHCVGDPGPRDRTLPTPPCTAGERAGRPVCLPRDHLRRCRGGGGEFRQAPGPAGASGR